MMTIKLNTFLILLSARNTTVQFGFKTINIDPLWPH